MGGYSGNDSDKGAEKNMALNKIDMAGGIDKTYPVRSRQSGALYQVTLWKSGAWSCDCADWINRRSQAPDHSATAQPFTTTFKGKAVTFEPHCKHILQDGIPAYRQPNRTESTESRFENLEIG